jgi:hypothetical protein
LKLKQCDVLHQPLQVEVRNSDHSCGSRNARHFLSELRQ